MLLLVFILNDINSTHNFPYSLVAGGIGLTPALSAMQNFQKTRNVSLIWIVRDESMLEFFFETLMNASNVDVCIFYTGKSKYG